MWVNNYHTSTVFPIRIQSPYLSLCPHSVPHLPTLSLPVTMFAQFVPFAYLLLSRHCARTVRPISSPFRGLTLRWLVTVLSFFVPFPHPLLARHCARTVCHPPFVSSCARRVCPPVWSGSRRQVNTGVVSSIRGYVPLPRPSSVSPPLAARALNFGQTISRLRLSGRCALSDALYAWLYAH